MYILVAALSFCIWFPAHAGEAVVKTYDDQQCEMSLRKSVSYNPKICAQIKQSLHQVPVVLCELMASFLEPKLDWSAVAYMEDSSIFMPDGYLSVVYTGPHEIAAGTNGRSIHRWDTSTKLPKLVAKFKGHTHSVAALDYDDNTRLLASGSYDGSARIWGQNSYKLKASGVVRTLAFITSNKLATGGIHDTFLQIWDVETQKSLVTNKGCTPMHVAKLTDSLFISTEGSYLNIYSTSDGRSLGSYPVANEPRKPVVIDREGSIFAVGFRDGVELFDVRFPRYSLFPEGTCRCTGIAKLPHTRPVTLLAMCGKKYLATCAPYEGTVKLWDVESILKSKKAELAKSSPAHVLSLPSQGAIALAANKEGTSLTAAVTGSPGFMQTWNLDRMQ